MKYALLSFLIIAVIMDGASAALNIDFSVTPTKNEFYDNESVSLELNITNYEISLTANNVKAIIKINDNNQTVDVEVIDPGKTSTKSLDIGKLETGTYKLENYVTYDFLGITDQTPTKYQNVRVLPSTPITMKLVSMYISEIKLSEEPKVGDNFKVVFSVNSSIDSGYIVYGLTGEKATKEDLKRGTSGFSIQYKLDKPGNYVFEVRTYDKEGDTDILKAYESKSFILIDLSKFEPIEFKPIDVKKGNVTTNSRKEPEKNLVDKVGCFVIGGCNGDLSGPEIRDIRILRSQGGKYAFSITADDSKMGNSVIDSCLVRFESENWSKMDAVDGLFDSSIERATSQLSTNALGEKNVEFKCYDQGGNTGYAAFKAELGCKDDKECGEDEVCSNSKCEKAKLIIAFIPVNWAGDLATFTTVAEGEINIFRQVTPLKECPNKVKVVLIPEVCNIDCTKGVDLVQIEKSCVERWTYSYDYAVALSNNEVCKANAIGGGFCCGPKSVFVEVYSNRGTMVTAHEIGHQFGLADEYCYSPTSKVNPTTEDLCPYQGCCKPMDETKKDEWYNYCKGHHDPPAWCTGNKNMVGGNCIMSSTTDNNIGFCQYCYNHLKIFPQLNCE